MRTLYDSVTASDIPLHAQMVGGYVNGHYKWSPADWARFPNAVHVPIATQANINDGLVGDVERGDMTPTQAVDWVIMRRHAGITPSLYVNELNNWATVRKTFQDAHIAEPSYWVARYRVDLQGWLPVGAVARQWADPAIHKQGHFDLSTVADYWPGIDQQPPKGNNMELNSLVHINLLNKDTGKVEQYTQTSLENLLAALYGTFFLPGIPENYQFDRSALTDVLDQVNAVAQKVDQLTTLLTELVNHGLPLQASGQITVSPSRGL